MADRPRLCLVRSTHRSSLAETASEFAGSVVAVREEPPPRQPLPPLKPRRPAAAVRKSLRAALAASDAMQAMVADADARIPAKARRTVLGLQAHARRVSQLTDELQLAVEREINYRLWRRGRPCAE